MPYIKPEDRTPLNPLIDQLCAALPAENFAGNLNYVMSRLCAGLLAKQKNYARINEIIGALECTKLELYRRVSAPSEDTQIPPTCDFYPAG